MPTFGSMRRGRDRRLGPDLRGPPRGLRYHPRPTLRWRRHSLTPNDCQASNRSSPCRHRRCRLRHHPKKGQPKERRFPRLWKRFGPKHVSPNNLRWLPSHPQEELSRVQISHPSSIFRPGQPTGGRLRWHRRTTQGRRTVWHRPTFGFLKERRPWPTTIWLGGCVRQPSSQPTGSS